VACAVQPGAPGGFQKVFFGSEEVAIPVFGRHALVDDFEFSSLTPTRVQLNKVITAVLATMCWTCVVTSEQWPC